MKIEANQPIKPIILISPIIKINEEIRKKVELFLILRLYKHIYRVFSE